MQNLQSNWEVPFIMVLELCNGGDLQELISQNVVMNDEERYHRWIHFSIPFYLRQIQEAINEIHWKEVVHCDIKPANVLLSRSGRVKLADFGSALDLSETRSAENNKPGDLLRGTTEYSAPELIRNLECDHPRAMDIWSFACLAIAMYIGESPFRSASESLCVQAITTYADNNAKMQSFWDNLSHSGAESGPEQTKIQSDMFKLRDLLQSDPSSRCKAWGDFIVHGAPDMDDANLQPPNSPCLPVTRWKDDVLHCQLRDGARGWELFMLS
eukprot:CAMPEP_0176002148 /NCGR_PEP_ID=MMETSP0120_2-20121206/496_1 /TAXON_ID=160619 /ORGANISM="Kryptoperidinium foliaceum, Strain CCMP 1326" /LENGTH=269 /DNA_ID=CAMNT_0017334725 /DNA_START=50 /DNA_END=859 /DNA_ORIENTATION=+